MYPDGTRYIWHIERFTVRAWGSDWEDVPGVYVFATNLGLRWMAIYVGQTTSFKDCLVDSHEHWAPAVENHGATHVHVLPVEDPEERDEIARGLIDREQPPMNTQLK